MTPLIEPEAIHALGFDWPKYPLIEEHVRCSQGKVDLDKTLQALRSSQAYYQKQLTEAFNFKMQHSTDYSDFTDKHEDNARMKRLLGDAIDYLESIIQAVDQSAAKP